MTANRHALMQLQIINIKWRSTAEKTLTEPGEDVKAREERRCSKASRIIVQGDMFPSPHVMSSRPEDVYPPILPDAQIIALEIVVDEPYITAWRCWICLGVSGQTA
jgi:hypothetical protein